jgi:hypothetical protein
MKLPSINSTAHGFSSINGGDGHFSTAHGLRSTADGHVSTGFSGAGVAGMTGVSSGVGGVGGVGPSSMGLETAIPGPLLRRAVTATVQDGVRREMAREKLGQSRSLKLTEEFRDVYTVESIVKGTLLIA